jgi:response regulator RpfG family c-di-GMP phosphodiesterase
MKEKIIKIKRTVRYLFYRNLNIKEQIEIADQLVDEKLLYIYWKMSKADRQHSYEVFSRTKIKSDNRQLLLLSLLHDIGKAKINAGLLFRVFSDLGLITNSKSKIYLNHEIVGLEILKKINANENIVEYYNNNLLKHKNIILDKTDY